MKKILAFLLIGVAIGTGCEKDREPENRIIRGTITQTDASMPEITTPIADIPVFLINLEASRDTLTSWYPPADLVDSTLTNESGEYSFLAAPQGNYLVMPRDTNQLYRFSWADSPDSIWIMEDSDQTAYEINFTTPEPQMENASYQIHCEVSFGNDFPKDTQGAFSSLLQVQPYIVVYRKARTWDFIGWGSSWGVPYPKFGWGSWYWRSSMRAHSFFNNHFAHVVGVSFDFTVDASNSVYQFKDEFLLEVHYETYEEDMVFHEWMKEDSKEMAQTHTMNLSENYPKRNLKITFNRESVTIQY